MNKFLLLFIIFFSAMTVRADYDPITLPEMIVNSELIVQGEIIEVKTETFVLKVEKLIKGKYDDALIEIQKFEDWTCANRWRKYEAGQKEFVFIVQNKENYKWILLGAGDESEIAILDEYVYYEDAFWTEKAKSKEFELQDGIVWGFKYDYKEFYDALILYMETYKTLFEKLENKEQLDTTNNSNSPYLRMLRETPTFYYIGYSN